jgi:PhnB protein
VNETGRAPTSADTSALIIAGAGQVNLAQAVLWLSSSSMTDIQPELWIDRADEAVAFYQAAFGARVLHCVGEGSDLVAQLAVGDAAFWVSSGGAEGPRFSPQAIGGATGRTLLVVSDPDAVAAQAVAAGATPASEVAEEHGWRLGRIFDPFGHEWEIDRPVGQWPPG